MVDFITGNVTFPTLQEKKNKNLLDTNGLKTPTGIDGLPKPIYNQKFNFNNDTIGNYQDKLNVGYVPLVDTYDQTGVEALKALRYGWQQGWSSAMYTTSGIPGWIDRTADAIVNFFGGEDEAEKWTYNYLYGDDFVIDNGILSEKDFSNMGAKLKEKALFKQSLDNNIFKKMTYHVLASINGAEEYLKEKAIGMRPEEQDWYEGFQPQGIIEKTISGFGSAVPTIIPIAAATALTRSPMVGFATVSFLDQYENESKASVAWNTLLGAVEGKAFGAVMGSPHLTWKGRAMGLGAIGASSAAVHGGSYDDVVSGAIVMSTFGVPFVSGTAKRLGIIKEKKIDPDAIKKEADQNVAIFEGKDIIADTVLKTSQHRKPILEYLEKKEESGYVTETKKDVLELDPRTLAERKSDKFDLEQYGNVEKLRIKKDVTEKQLKENSDIITFERVSAKSKIENKNAMDSVLVEKVLKEDTNADINRKIEATKLKEEVVYEDISLSRDQVFNNGKLLDVYVRLNSNGTVIGFADAATRASGPTKRSIFTEARTTEAFAERFNLNVGKDGSVIAKLSDLIKIKEVEGIRNKKTKTWLQKAIKDATKLKEQLETSFEKRVNKYDKSLNESIRAGEVAYNTLIKVDAFKNIGLSKEKNFKELMNVVYEANREGQLLQKESSLKKNERGEVERDVNASEAKGLLKLAKKGAGLLEQYLISPKFIGGQNSSRIIKGYISAVERMKLEIESMVDTIAYKKRIITDKKGLEDRRYVLDEGSTRFGIRYLLASAMSDVRVQRGKDGALTGFEALISRGGKEGIDSAVKIMQARINRDNVMYQEAINNVKGKKTNEAVEAEYLTKNADGTFKYQMPYERMQKEFKLSNKELEIVRYMDEGLALYLNVHNSYAKKYADQGQKIIDSRPNYDVRSWFGKERAFIKAKEKVTLENGIELDAGKTVAAIPGHSRSELKGFMDFFLKENPEFADKSKFEVFYVTKEAYAEKSGVGLIDAFETSHQFFDLLPTDVVSKIRKAEVTYRKKQALFTAPLQRTGVRGFAGEQGLTGLQYYAKAHKDYGFGAIRAAKSMEFKSNWETGLYGQTGNQLRRDFPNQVKIAEMYIDNALGRNPAETAKVINKAVDTVSSAFRDITAKLPYVDKVIPDVMASANTFALYKNLLFYTARFLKAQVVQPWQVIVPKLDQLKLDYGIKGDTSYALLKSSYEIHARTDKQFLEAVKIAVEKGAIDQKFLKEFVDSEMGVLSTKGRRQAKGLQDIATGKSISGTLERYSRLQAFGQMYYFLKSAERDAVVGRKEMINEAIELTNNLMVQYDYRNRPLLYGNQGLGKVGPLVGLFKTFQHNYYGKTLEYFRTYTRSETFRSKLKKTITKPGATLKGKEGIFKDISPLLFHFQTQVLTAGMFGIMAMEQADWFVGQLNKYFVDAGVSPPLLSPSELILRSELPNAVKFGLPSGTIGGDLSSTLAAPGIGVGSVFSSPALDFFFGLTTNPHAGLIGEPIHMTAKAIAGTLTDADIYKYLKILSPAILQGEIDRRWGVTGTSRAGLPLSEVFGLKDPTKLLVHDQINNVYYQKEKDKYIIKDPYKGMRGKIKRDAEGFMFKYLGGKSFEESLILKTIWATTKMSRNIKSKVEAYVIGGAQELQNGRYDTALFYVEGLMDQGYTYDEAMKKILNRMEMANNTVIDRVKGLDKGAKTNLNNFILDVLKNNRLDDSYFPGSAYN